MPSTAKVPARRAFPILPFALVLALAAGCEPVSTPPPSLVVEVQGVIDPVLGIVTFGDVDAGTQLASVANVPVEQDGKPGTGTEGHVELVTEAVGYDAACGRPSSFCAKVTIRAFFANRELHNVFFEIVEMTPAIGGLGIASTGMRPGEPGYGQVSAQYGLWAYPALLDTGNSTLGSSAASRWWRFDMLDSQPRHFTGRVMADLVTPASGARGLLGTCAGVATDLGKFNKDCGECARRAPGGTACNYAVAGGFKPSGSGQAIDWSEGLGVICKNPAVACDTGSSTTYACVNLQTDAGNCGVCGNVCKTGTCTSGVCAP